MTNAMLKLIIHVTSNILAGNSESLLQFVTFAQKLSKWTGRIVWKTGITSQNSRGCVLLISVVVYHHPEEKPDKLTSLLWHILGICENIHLYTLSSATIKGCLNKLLKHYFFNVINQKVNVYLPSLMMKVPDHLYVLGDTYTCHTYYCYTYNFYAY
jgi:hypothetical protein